MDALLDATRLLDYKHPSIQDLITKRGWVFFDDEEKIRAAYDFVRNEIRFGYNEDDAIPASRVLEDGYGQCNTKGILLMALLRSLRIRCRLHGFTIDKALQKGAITGLWYYMAPREIVHSWIEVDYRDRWINLEGFIIDNTYLQSVQRRFSSARGGFCGFGIATACIEAPSVEWEGGDTYIQKEGIARDFGMFNSPDEFFLKHAQQLGWGKKAIYRLVARHAMNRSVSRVRNSHSKSIE